MALFDDCVIKSKRGLRGIIFNLPFNCPQRGAICLQYEHRELWCFPLRRQRLNRNCCLFYRSHHGLTFLKGYFLDENFAKLCNSIDMSLNNRHCLYYCQCRLRYNQYLHYHLPVGKRWKTMREMASHIIAIVLSCWVHSVKLCQD